MFYVLHFQGKNLIYKDKKTIAIFRLIHQALFLNL
jgi:hypothetical protein